MGLIVSFEQSHRYSFTTPVKGAFLLSLVPSSTSVARGLHYILVIDTSGSMAGRKIEAAKEAALRLIRSLPGDNYVSIILFGTRGYPFYEVKMSHRLLRDARQEAEKIISSMVPADGTPLFNALKAAIEVAAASKEPGYIIMLTDGKPTDVVDLSKYEVFREKWPCKHRGVFIGIGLDYNADLLNKLADISGGVAVHVEEARVEELVGVFEEAAVSEAAARGVEVVLEAVAGGARFLGYEEPRVVIPVVGEEAVELIGEVEIPAGYDGVVAVVTVSYEDPASGRRESKVFEYRVRPASSREEFLSGINRRVYNMYLYAVYMEEARRLALQGRLDEATRRLEKAAEAAAQTRRVELVEGTKRMIKEIEATKRTGRVEDTTRRVAGEATKRLRGL